MQILRFSIIYAHLCMHSAIVSSSPYLVKQIYIEGWKNLEQEFITNEHDSFDHLYIDKAVNSVCVFVCSS